MTDSANDINPLKLAYARRFPREMANYLTRYGADAIAQVLEALPADVGAGVVAGLPHGHALRLLAGRDDPDIVSWLEAAELNRALTILLHVEPGRRSAVLRRLPNRRKRRMLRQLVAYPADTVGAMVDSAAVRLEIDMPLGKAAADLRGNKPEAHRSIWLVDREGNYRGLLDSGRALAASSDRSGLKQFLVHVQPIRAETMLANACDYDEWLDHAELPVIDQLGHLLGSITRGRIIESLGEVQGYDAGLVDGVGELALQYFRVMGICLGDLFGRRGVRR